MKTTVRQGDAAAFAADVLVLPLASRAKAAKNAKKKAKASNDRADVPLSAPVRALDRALGGVVSAALAAGDFRGRSGQTAVLYPPRDGTDAPKIQRVILTGLGVAGEETAETLRRAAGSAMQRARSIDAGRVSVQVPRARGVRPDAAAEALTQGVVLGSYRFDRYRRNGGKKAPRALTLYVDERVRGLAAVRRAVSAGLAIAESQNVARDLSNEPGNELPPAELAKAARKVARESGLRCRVMDEVELKRRKMGGVLAVGQGSSRPPRVIVLEYGAARARRPTICLVGKGITFDSGGISIKPAASMEEMKHDMSGAAAVIGAMRAIAALEVPLHVVGVIASAENLPSATAYRPGDVVRTCSGKTIEVINTDAEGRIVLADALHYAVDTWNPVAMIDLATLTGACQVALGPWASGLLGNDDALIEKVRAAGDASGETAWPLPLFDEHKKAMDSTVADLKNSGGRFGGASTAAGFLSAFVGETPWVHLDIAGTGWTSTQGPYQPVGGTGVGVRLLVELLRAWR